MPLTYEELRSWTDEDLIANFDHHGEHTYINSVNFFLEEMARRRAERQGEI